MSEKVALVTGGASGIGRQTALLLGREGAKVAVADIDRSGAESAAVEVEGLGAATLALELDVTSEEGWKRAVDRVVDTWGKLDVLVNCAGIADDAPITELPLAKWRRVLATNLDGTFLGTAAAIRAMATAGVGSIVNVSSVSGIKASPGASAYSVSKAAIIHFCGVAALECAAAGHRIRVNCVAPGGVKTPMWETTPMWPDISKTDEWNAPPDAPALKRFAEPLEIAQAILFLASDDASYVTGTTLVVDGGATA